jgi:hypothetical protein
MCPVSFAGAEEECCQEHSTPKRPYSIQSCTPSGFSLISPQGENVRVAAFLQVMMGDAKRCERSRPASGVNQSVGLVRSRSKGSPIVTLLELFIRASRALIPEGVAIDGPNSIWEGSGNGSCPVQCPNVTLLELSRARVNQCVVFSRWPELPNNPVNTRATPRASVFAQEGMRCSGFPEATDGFV